MSQMGGEGWGVCEFDHCMAFLFLRDLLLLFGISVVAEVARRVLLPALDLFTSFCLRSLVS
jgi:hypothetical protein